MEATKQVQTIASTQPQSATPQTARLVSRGLDRFDWACIVALLFSFVLVNRLPFGASKYGDLYFHEEAKQVAQVMHGLSSWHDIQIARAPLPVLYYAVPYFFVPPNSADEAYWQAAVAWNVLWMLFSLLLIRRSGELFGGARAGKIAAVISLVVPFAVYYSFGIAAETPAYVAAVVFTYGWTLWRKAAPPGIFKRGSLVACIGLVALLLCRPNALVVLGITCACGAGLWKRSDSHSRSDLRFAAVCVGVSLLSVFLVSVSLKYLADKRGVNLQATNFSYVLFQGSFQFRSEPWDWRNWGKATRTGSVDYNNWLNTQNELLAESAQSRVSISRLLMNWSLRDIVHHPVERLKMFAIRALALNVWVVHSTSPERFSVALLPKRMAFLLFHVFLNAIALLLPVASIWFLAKNRQAFFGYWPLWAPWLGLLLFHSFVYAEPRYRLPRQPGETLMAACVMARMIEHRESLTIGTGRLS